MSDYISKSALLKEFDPNGELLDPMQVRSKIVHCPTLDEKEIIRKAFERVLTRLEEYWRTHKAWEDYEMFNGTYIEMLQHEKVVKAYEKAIKIVKEECGISE